MDNIPKPTSEFNRLIGEADYLMSLISLEIQCRLNYFNPISEEMEIFEKLPRTKKKTYINLNFTNGNPKLKAKFKETLEGKQINFGGYEKKREQKKYLIDMMKLSKNATRSFMVFRIQLMVNMLKNIAIYQKKRT